MTVMLDVRVPAKQFRLVLIKPSHYDDDGYVIRWWRAMIPSNSLAAIYGIAADCAERHVLGPGVAIAIDAIDETHTRVKVPTLLARFRRHGNFGLGRVLIKARLVTATCPLWFTLRTVDISRGPRSAISGHRKQLARAHRSGSNRRHGTIS